MLGLSTRDTADQRLSRSIATVNTLLFAIFFFWLTTYRTWQFDTSKHRDSFGGNFYWLQAEAILKGRLWLDSEGFECIYLDGHCHGYFGPFPSLLRIPFVALFGNTYENLSPVFMSLSAGLAFFAFANLFTYINFRNRLRNSRTFELIAAQILLMGFGASSVLVLSAHPRVYEEAVLWSVAMTSVAINLAYRWFEDRHNTHLVLILLCGCSAVLSRPTSQPFFLVLGVVIFLLAMKTREWKIGAYAVAITVLPLVLLATYSLTNIGVIGFDATTWWPYNNILIVRNIIDSNDGQTVGLRFLPTVIANHLRFTNLSYELSWPFVSAAQDWYGRSTYIFPIKAENMFIAYSPGLPAIVPGTALFGGLGYLIFVIRRKSQLVANNFGLATISIAALGSAVMSMSYYAMNARYLTDVYPFLSLGLLVFSIHIFSKESTTITKIVIFGSFFVFSVYSLLALIAVHTDIVPWL